MYEVSQAVVKYLTRHVSRRIELAPEMSARWHGDSGVKPAPEIK
jgi:hypothetical protein